MPLLDHFRSPLADERHWESFHASWANEIMASLNQGGLPDGYFAETQVHIGGRVEVDVASFQAMESAATGPDRNGGVALQSAVEWTVLTLPAVFPDEIEVQVFRRRGGTLLVGAIELVSPGNKDRPESRRAFAAKCLAYLQSGVGLLVVDVVTERQANLHDELIRIMDLPESYRFPAPLYSASYYPVRDESLGDRIETRLARLRVGDALPTMPLTLSSGPTVSVDLEASYAAARRRSLL